MRPGPWSQGSHHRRRIGTVRIVNHVPRHDAPLAGSIRPSLSGEALQAQTASEVGLILNAMTFAPVDLIPAATALLSAGFGAYVGGRAGDTNRRKKESDARRSEAAKDCLQRFKHLRELLTQERSAVTHRTWVGAVAEALEALDDAAHVIPPGMRTLRPSVRAAIGEALGSIALLQLEPEVRTWPIDAKSKRWNRYAWEYLDFASDALRVWRDSDNKTAFKVQLMSFDEWLERTGRYRPGQSGSTGELT